MKIQITASVVMLLLAAICPDGALAAPIMGTSQLFGNTGLLANIRNRAAEAPYRIHPLKDHVISPREVDDEEPKIDISDFLEPGPVIVDPSVFPKVEEDKRDSLDPLDQKEEDWDGEVEDEVIGF